LGHIAVYNCGAADTDHFSGRKFDACPACRTAVAVYEAHAVVERQPVGRFPVVLDVALRVVVDEHTSTYFEAWLYDVKVPRAALA